MIAPRLARAYAFFRSFGRNPAWNAWALAKAECDAEDLGIEFSWESDPEPYETDIPEDKPREVWGVVARFQGRVLASLWGIGDPERDYMRFEEASLAWEAIDALDAEQTYAPLIEVA